MENAEEMDPFDRKGQGKEKGHERVMLLWKGYRLGLRLVAQDPTGGRRYISGPNTHPPEGLSCPMVTKGSLEKPNRGNVEGRCHRAQRESLEFASGTGAQKGWHVEVLL